MIDLSKAALILAVHGSARHPEAARAAEAHAAVIRRQGRFAEVHAAFWKHAPFWRDALAAVRSEAVYVVPILASRGRITETVLPHELGLADPAAGARVRLCAPVGVHPKLPELLDASLTGAAREAGLDAKRCGLLLAGHGSPVNPQAIDGAETAAALLRLRGHFADTATAYLEQEPHLSEWRRLLPTETVIVAPFMVSGGHHAAVDIPGVLGFDPAALARTGPEATGRLAGPKLHDGRRLWLARTLGSEPFIADLAVDQARAWIG